MRAPITKSVLTVTVGLLLTSSLGAGALLRPGPSTAPSSTTVAASDTAPTSTPATAVARTGTGGEAHDPRRFAPVDRPGPDLSIPEGELADSVTCTANATDAAVEVPIFVPATALDADEFAWNWFPALEAAGLPYCFVTIPDDEVGDAQVSAEYVVNAVRHVHETSGRQVAVLGHSQGGLLARFALRFWPDLRPMVADYVAFGAPNHGSQGVQCSADPGCPPAYWQLRDEADYVAATNSVQETFPGISYTNVYTHIDEYATPNLDHNGTSSLHGGGGAIVNVAVQDVCASSTSEHIAIGTYGPVAHALAMDAMTHDGPADPARLTAETCAPPVMPGVDVAELPAGLAAIATQLARGTAAVPAVGREPALEPYVLAG